MSIPITETAVYVMS